MIRSMMVPRVAPLFAFVAFSLAAPVQAEEKQGVVAPSEYLEDIETPGDTGGVMDEVDSAEAQAEAAAKAKKSAGEPKPVPEESDDGGW